ncbi:uncharacterized protein LOC119500418 [Sebastes umbrosus]|uniref:uncharacterized protein LOC119500418 n=1 Tax=Sebastes umbrosus TaxID=72105 RepID=UPI00189C93AB|nr:uncharacterized protein LOC119500418 [Sebastes umbrosus]
MVMSSGSTVVYLSRHMRRMVANGQSLSGPRFSGQVRVAVICIIQGVLYMFCAVWIMLCSGREQRTSGSEQLSAAKHLKYNSLNQEDDAEAQSRRPGLWIKQPLKLLLGSLICCTILYLMSFFVMLFSQLLPGKVAQIPYVVANCSLTSSMTSSVWLNFFYYTQVVPARRALFIWIKKNIKSIIYCIWLVDRLYSVLDFTVEFIESYRTDGFGSSTNFTTGHDLHSSKLWLNILIIAVCMVKANFVFCLCVMVMSSGSTVVYLSRHMCRMVANGQSLSGPRFNGQVRVTVTGILQGVLYMFCAVWIMYMFITDNSFMSIGLFTYLTIINLYMSGTTFNLGAGQAVFRQRATHIWLRAAQCCKAPQVQQSEPGG